MTNKEACNVLARLYDCTKIVSDNLCKGVFCCDCKYNISKEQVLEALEMALKSMEPSDWIPCDEKMPETHQSDFGGVFSGIIRSCKVLVTSESRDVFECRAVETMYSGLCWIDANECQRDDIIAWMPLPEPYRG